MKTDTFQKRSFNLKSDFRLKCNMLLHRLMIVSIVCICTLNSNSQLIGQQLPENHNVNSKVNAATNTTTYATWIMVWVGSTEPWFNPEVYNGATMWVNNTWKATNWNDNAQVNEFVLNMKNAGIKIIICDLTNGFTWMSKVKYIQGLCAQHGMQVCVAMNYKGNFTSFETLAKSIYDNLSGPNAANNASYFQKDGKPAIVNYCTKTQFDAVELYSSVMRDRFNLLWASGEESQQNKWGWQLEPKVGPVPSPEAMFVSPSIKWAPSSTPGMWRKSLAWLDYNFQIARQNNPQYIIVGSYDDIRERNGWLVANTTGSEAGMQMRDKTGAISTDAFNTRVKEWISGSNVSTISGGLILDGCYYIRNKRSNFKLQMRNGDGIAGALVEQSSSATYPMNQYFWFYHLGNNVYRIIPLTTGLPLAPVGASLVSNTKIEQNWDLDVDHQKWIIEENTAGVYSIKNKLSEKYLDVYPAGTGSVVSGASIVQANKSTNEFQLWKLEPIVQLPANITDLKSNNNQDVLYPKIQLVGKTIVIEQLKGINKVYIYNAVGQLITSQELHNQSFQLNAEKGLLLVVLALENGNKVVKKMLVN